MYKYILKFLPSHTHHPYIPTHTTHTHTPHHTHPHHPPTHTHHTQDDYTHPGALDPDNEYSTVTDKQRENTSPGYLHQQTNVLYADQFAATEMKHATITRSGQSRYIGTTTLQGSMADEPEETDSCCSGRACLWITLCALLIFISLVAIAALALVLMMMLHVIPVCNCAASECGVSVCATVPQMSVV